ncbi:hypothetical protein SLEP1_g13638 [Rubroshorea leprosula]|uniref:Uncharacterized protein n=1 Tax=Rubroshorea leprosula TaxID=152421 RepID=A0AAV5IR75_9ROSI|nr:hypothetical protein SLEP1_g13638 [Rubroshorea leprosula]
MNPGAWVREEPNSRVRKEPKNLGSRGMSLTLRNGEDLRCCESEIVVSQDTSARTYWKVEDNCISLHRPHGTPISGVSYAFDHVFNETYSNAQVYKLLTRDLIHVAVEGFNGILLFPKSSKFVQSLRFCFEPLGSLCILFGSGKASQAVFEISEKLKCLI